MKKSIFLFFAAILCAMTANAQWALMGTLTDWSSGKAMSVSGTDATCTVDLPGKTTYTLKVKTGNTWYGRNSTTISATTTTSAFSTSGGDVTLNTDIPGTYTFSFNTSTKKLTVTYPTAPAPHDITVRAQVPAHWTNNIYAHVWTSENASGQDVGPLTKNGDYYEVTKNAGALYVIFKNGSAWSNPNQTVDLCYTEDVCLQINQSGSAKATATVIECGAIAKDITVKAVVPGAWENTITAWVWPTGGEGKEVTPTKDGNWYVVTENCIELNVIFKNGTGWNGNENQTANITGVSENTCYQISAINKDGEGKCTYTVVDCEAAIEPEAKPVDVYTVVGSDVLLGTAWDVNNADNEMTKQDDGSYVLVKENVDLATTGTYEYKVVKNHSWDWSVPSGNANQTLKLGNEDVDGTYNVTFTLNKELNALTASLELVEAKKVIPECYVAGDESLTGQNWNEKSVLMTYDEATEIYTATLTAVPAGTHNMKVVYGGEWLGFDHLATPAPANVKEGEDKKIQFTLAEAGDVTVTYHATNGIGLTGNFAAPAPEVKKYYVKGTHNEWTADATSEMTLDGEVYKKEVTLAADVQFKINDGADAWWGKDNLGGKTYAELDYTDDGNIKMKEEKTFTVIFDPANNLITFEDLTVVEDYYTIVGATAITGVNWDSANEDNKMTKDGEVYTLTKTDLQLEAGDYEYKVAKNGAWGDGQYPAEGNEKVTITETAVYTIVYTYNVGTSLTAVATKTGEYTPAQTVYTVAGDAALCGSDWKADDTTNDMTDNGDGTFTWTKTGVTLTGNVGFKVVKNHDFGNGAYPNDNWVIDIAGATGVYDVTITFKEDDKNITVVANKTGDLSAETLVYTVTVPAGTEKCYIAGEMNSWEFTLMTQVDATHWTISFDNVTRATQYKYSASDSWAYGEKRNDNRTWAAADEVTEWNKPDTYTVAGTADAFGTEWDAANTANDMTLQSDGTYAWTKTNLELSANVEFKIVKNHSWDNDKWPAENKVIEITEAGTYDLAIYFNTAETEQEGNGIYVVLTKQTPATPTPDYTRATTEGNFGTICLPFGSTNYTGMELFECVGQETGKVYIASVTTLEAGVPYIFLATGTELAVYSDGTTAATPGDHNGLHGTFTDDTEVDENDYILLNNELRPSDGNAKVNANRAYLVMSEVPASAPVKMPGRRYIGMKVQGEGTTTGFENITTTDKAVKIIENGQLIIMRDGVKYNAQGQRF